MKGKQPSTRHRSAFVDCQIGYKSVYIHGIPVPKIQEKHSLLGRVFSRGVSVKIVKNSTILYLFCQNSSGGGPEPTPYITQIYKSTIAKYIHVHVQYHKNVAGNDYQTMQDSSSSIFTTSVYFSLQV